MRHVVRWLFPGGIVAALAVAALVLEPQGDPDFPRTVTDGYAAIVYLVAAGLAVVFHRSRVLALVLALGMAELAAGFGWLDGVPHAGMALGLALLVGVGSLLRDRGITSVVGVAQVSGALAWTGLWMGALDRDLEPWSGLVPQPVDPPASFPWIQPDAAVLGALGLAFVLVVAAAYRHRGPVERGAFWGLGLVVASGIPGLETPEVSILRMGAALTLGLAVLETSYAMAYRDELTGLPARRSLLRDLEGLTGRYTLAMVDVDHFKKFNDKHGHDVGDQVLRLVASRLGNAPAGGRAYRYGGEEFTLLYKGLARDEAEAHLEAVRASVAAARFSLRRWSRPARKEAGTSNRGRGPKRRGKAPRTLSVTVSIGMADSTGASVGGPEAVLKKADKALYRAKRGGRNRVSA